MKISRPSTRKKTMTAIANVSVYRFCVASPACVTGVVGKKPGGCSLPGCGGSGGTFAAPEQAATIEATRNSRAIADAMVSFDRFRRPTRGTQTPGLGYAEVVR